MYCIMWIPLYHASECPLQQPIPYTIYNSATISLSLPLVASITVYCKSCVGSFKGAPHADMRANVHTCTCLTHRHHTLHTVLTRTQKRSPFEGPRAAPRNCTAKRSNKKYLGQLVAVADSCATGETNCTNCGF